MVACCVFAAERNPSWTSAPPRRHSTGGHITHPRIGPYSEESQVPQPLEKGERSTARRRRQIGLGTTVATRQEGGSRSTSAFSSEGKHLGPVYRYPHHLHPGLHSTTYLPRKQYYSVLYYQPPILASETPPLLYIATVFQRSAIPEFSSNCGRFSRPLESMAIFGSRP